MKWLIAVCMLLPGCGTIVIEPEPGMSCEIAADCDDGDPCTADRCASDGVCVYSAVGGETCSEEPW
jgi:hypothetical protein